MLTNSPVTPTIPITDLTRAKEFYEQKLGLKPIAMVMPEDSVLYECGGGTYLYIYQRGPSKADHTLATFRVDNIEEAIDELSQKGVGFEHYDMPNIKTDEKGIATMGTYKSAWFKDPDGNTLALMQM